MPSSTTSDLSAIRMATTNYGNIVAYNHGTISNYFCFNSETAHQCHFPVIKEPKDTPESQLHSKIKRARRLYTTKRWVEAKILFYEILKSDLLPHLDTVERILAQYHLARTHFTLAEFGESCRHFQNVLNACAEQQEEPDTSLRDSRYWLARSLYHLQKYETASMEFQALILSSESDPSLTEQITQGRLWFGLTCEHLGHFEAAKVQLQTAYESQNRTHGHLSLETLACRHHLANFLYKQKAFLDAHGHFEALLDAEECLTGPEKAEAVKSRCMVAFCLAKLERFEEAEPHLQRVLSNMDTRPGLDPIELRNVGLVFYWLGRITLSKKHKDSKVVYRACYDLQRGLNLISDTIGSMAGRTDDNRDLQDELVNCRRFLAQAMCLRGDFAGSELILRQVVDTMDHSRQDDSIASQYWFACSLLSQRKRVEAVAALETLTATASLENCRHTGEDLAACLTLLGEAYMDLEQPRQASGCYQRVVDATPSKPNLHHNECRRLLAVTLFELEVYDDANRYFKAFLDSLEQLLPEKEQGFADNETQMWFSWSLCESGRFAEAEPYLHPTFIVYEQQSGRPTPASDFILGRSHYYLGRILLHQKDVEGAVSQFRTASAMLNRRFGPDNQIYLQCRYHLAQSLFRSTTSNGLPNAARSLQLSEARRIFEELLHTKCEHSRVEDIRRILVPFWLGRILLSQRKAKEAEEYFARISDSIGESTSLPLHANISTRHIQYWHASCLYHCNKVEKGIEILRTMLHGAQEDDFDNDRELFNRCNFLLGNCFYFTYQFEDAARYLKAAVKLHEDQHGPWHGEIGLTQAFLADSLCEMRNYAEAEPTLIKAAARQDPPNNTDGNTVKAIGSYWLGRHAFFGGGWDEAESYFRTVLPLLSQHSRWDRIRLDTRHFLARIKLRNKQYAIADVSFKELALQNSHMGDIKHRVDNQYWYGHSLYQQNKLDAALVELNKSLDNNSDGRLVRHIVPSSHALIGRCLHRASKTREAKEHYEIALQSPENPPLFPSVLGLRWHLGVCEYRLALYAQAKDNFQLLISAQQNDPDEVCNNHHMLGKSLFHLENWTEAIVHLQFAHENKASRKQWSDPLECQFYLGRAHFKAGLYDIASCHFRTICEENTDNASNTVFDSHYHLGITLFEMKKFDKSRDAFMALLGKRKKQKPPNNLGIMTARYHLGRCFFRLGCCQPARRQMETVLPFFEQRIKNGDATIIQVQYELASEAQRHSEWDRASGLYEQALVNHSKPDIKSSLDITQYQSGLAMVRRKQQRYEEAAELYHEILSTRRKSVEAPHELLLGPQALLADTLCWLGKFSEAASLVLEALEWQEHLPDASCFDRLPLQLILARVAYGESDFDTAEDLYAQAIELLESDPMAERVAYEPISLYRSMHALCLYKLDQIEDAKLQATKVVTRGDSQQYRWYPELVEFSDILLMRITDLSSDGKAASRELRSDSHTGSESGPQQCTTHEEDEVSKSALQEVTVSQSPVRCRSIERRLHDEEVLDGQVAGETISVRTLD